MDEVLALRDFLLEQPWMKSLSREEQARVLADAYERQIPAGGYVCRCGDAATQWFGVISGLVKASVMSPDGKTTSYASISSGGWLGEGSVLQGAIRHFDVIALRNSRVACIPRVTFRMLYSFNLDFCHYLIDQLNKRLAQQMALIEIDRLVDPETKVAKCIAMLASQETTELRPCTIRITQGEIAQLCGLSRQFTNRVMAKLASLGMLDHHYGNLTILDPEGLQRYKAKK